MRRGLTKAALMGSVLLMSGCAGIPTAVSFASIYVNSLLVLRTNKGVADHVVSAAMDQDCGFVNILTQGEYCTDGPAPQLLVAMMADADHLTDGMGAPTFPAKDQMPADTTVAQAPVVLIPLKPTQTQTAAIPTPTVPTPIVTTSTVQGGPRVVLGSYRLRASADEHRVRLGRPDSAVVAAQRNGGILYRVVIETDSASRALRELTLARDNGTPDAWMTGAGGATPAPSPTPAPRTTIAQPVTPADAPTPHEPVLVIPLLADVELTPII